MVFRYSKRARTFFTKYVPSRSFGGHVTWNSAVPDPKVWCCILLFLCTLDVRQWHASEMARSRSHDVFLCATILSTVTASAQLWSKEFWDFLGSRRGKRLLCCSLSWTTTPALWVSVRRRKGGVRTGRRRWTADVSALVDISDSATTTTSPRPGDASPTTSWTGCIFFACLSMTSTQDRTTTYRVTTCATATRLSLVVWHVWRFLVRYNNRGRRRRVDQNERSFLSFFFHF